MSLIERIKRDARRFVSNGNDFAVPIIFSDGTLTATVKGTVKKHHMGYDAVGNLVITTQATCTISEADLIDQSYPVRSNTGRVNINNNTVSWADSNGTVITYKITQCHPDEILGLLVCILSN